MPVAISTACVELLAADGAAVLLMAEAGVPWQVAAAVGRLTLELEQAQLTVGEGPAVEAYHSGGPVLVPNAVAVAGRWPGLASVLPSGVRALFAFPLQVGAVRFGVLEMYSSSPGRWDGAQLSLALRVVDCSADALLFSVGSAGGDALDWLDRLPGTVPEIDQAAGMSSILLGVSLPIAYARLRGYAFGHDQSLAAISRGVVAGRLRLDDDGPPTASRVE